MSNASSDAALLRLRKQAKRWLKALRSGDAEALTRLRRVLPAGSEKPGLREVQQALARELGHASWAALKAQHESALLTNESDEELHAQLLRNACLSYGDDDWPSKWRRAERIRVLRPSLATASLHAAVVCGEIEHVRALLARDPAMVSQRGGPQAWEPLLFACYGRLPNARAAEGSLEIVRLLLDHGADPNAYFVMGDLDYRFTALTGAMGQGELGQPPHPHAEELAQLLLERGANANDSQGLYNTHLEGDDTRWLELLSRHGFDASARINWKDPDDGVAPRVLDYLVVQAAANGHEQRLRWLLAHGADPNARSRYDGKSGHHTALLAGQPAIAALLVEHGAAVRPLEGRDAFLAACMRGDRSEAERLLDGHREYLTGIEPLNREARRGELQRCELLLQLGMDPNGIGKHGQRPLHAACKHPGIVDLLLRHGADARARCFGGTLSGWARSGNDPVLARRYAELSRSLLDAVSSGHVELVEQLLAEDRGCIGERSPSGDTALHELPDDEALAESLIERLLVHGADPTAVNDAGHTPARRLVERGLDPIADLLEAAVDARA